MSSYPDLPDIEAAAVAILMADLRVTALTTEDKISTELPDDFESTNGEQRVQVFSNLSDTVDGRTQVIHRPIVQVNAFGATKEEAFAVASAATKALKDIEGQMVGPLNIYAVDIITAPSWDPDPSTDIPRYVGTFGIVTRSR